MRPLGLILAHVPAGVQRTAGSPTWPSGQRQTGRWRRTRHSAPSPHRHGSAQTPSRHVSVGGQAELEAHATPEAGGRAVGGDVPPVAAGTAGRSRRVTRWPHTHGDDERDTRERQGRDALIDATPRWRLEREEVCVRVSEGSYDPSGPIEESERGSELDNIHIQLAVARTALTPV